jgi:hypothetical protein
MDEDESVAATRQIVELHRKVVELEHDIKRRFCSLTIADLQEDAKLIIDRELTNEELPVAIKLIATNLQPYLDDVCMKAIKEAANQSDDNNQ